MQLLVDTRHPVQELDFGPCEEYPSDGHVTGVAFKGSYSKKHLEARSLSKTV